MQPGPLSEPLTLKSSAYSLSLPNSCFWRVEILCWLAASPTLVTISFSFSRLEDAITAQHVASHLVNHGAIYAILKGQRMSYVPTSVQWLLL